jgi:hypothetical protein
MGRTRQTGDKFSSRRFMLEQQYKVLPVSILMGCIWLGVQHELRRFWFLSRLSLMIAIISFVPAALVVLVHGRSFGPFFWWDKSNVVLTTRRSPKVEKIELIVMSVLWTVIFGFIAIAIFFLSQR